MDFKKRLERAAERGQQTRDDKARLAAAQAMSEQEWQRLHSECRIVNAASIVLHFECIIDSECSILNAALCMQHP